MTSSVAGLIHHVELWVPDLDRAIGSWGWLLTELGYQQFQRWTGGVSFRLGPGYIVLERSTDLLAGPHERCRAGLNHLAFHATDRAQVDRLTAAAPQHGWRLLFPDRHPTPTAPTSTPPTWRTPTATRRRSSHHRQTAGPGDERAALAVGRAPRHAARSAPPDRTASR